MQVRVASTTRTVLDSLSKKHGVTAKGLVARLLDWFAEQDPLVRNAMLYPDGDPSAELLRVQLGKVPPESLKSTVGELQVEPAFVLMRSLIDRLEKSHRDMSEDLKTKMNVIDSLEG